MARLGPRCVRAAAAGAAAGTAASDAAPEEAEQESADSVSEKMFVMFASRPASDRFELSMVGRCGEARERGDAQRSRDLGERAA